MRLCFLASANSIHSVKWIKYFAKMGHEIHWISLTPSIVGDINNVKFYQILGLEEFFPFSFFINLIRVKKLIKKINPDIVHAHYAGTNGVLAALSGFRPLIITVWGSDVLITEKSKIKGPFVRLALRRADLITCDADHMREAMIALRINYSKIKIIYFGIDVKKFSQGKADLELKKRLKTVDCLSIISLRNLESIYDVETLIKAVPIVLKKVKNIKFIIMGRGTEEKKLKELVQNLNILDKVKFTGSVPNDDLPKYLKMADIYVSTALSDAGISSSTAEAMACGLPVVITNTGENEKWVRNGEGGYLISVKSPEILAEKIIYLLKNEEIRKRFGEINRKTIEEKNDYYREMEKMEKLYYSSLSSRQI